MRPRLGPRPRGCSGSTTGLGAGASAPARTEPFAAVTQVYVARIGATGYVVRFPEDWSGEWTILSWFDNKWVFKQQLAS